MERGEPETAVAEMEKETLTGGRLAGLAMAYYALGRKTESDAALASMIREQGNVVPFQIAEAYAFRGDRDQAFQWLERAYAQKESDLLVHQGRHAAQESRVAIPATRSFYGR